MENSLSICKYKLFYIDTLLFNLNYKHKNTHNYKI